jgi:hypothetical protein
MAAFCILRNSLRERRLGEVLRGGCLFRGAHRIEEAKELLDSRDFQSIMHAVAHADQCKTSLAVLPGHISPHKCANARRIGIGDIGEIDDQRLRGIGPDGSLKIKYGGQDKGPIEAKDTLTWGGSWLVFNPKGIGHRGMVTLQLRVIVKAVLISGLAWRSARSRLPLPAGGPGFRYRHSPGKPRPG